MTSKMLAFVNTTVTKPQILRQLRAHAKADAIEKGYYWNDGKGCAVGCTIHSSNHLEYESRFGIPQMLAHLEDTIFEGLSDGEAKKWPVRFIAAVQPGSDLSLVGWRFLRWLLTDRQINPGIEHPLVRDAIMRCADILVPLTQGQGFDSSAARSAAWSAESAARSAESAAWSAESAARAARGAKSAAASAAASAAWSAESAAYVRMADKLLALIEAAPVQ
jgi:hypothetical protein